MLEKFYEIRAKISNFDVVSHSLSPHATPTSDSDSNILDMIDEVTFASMASLGDEDTAYLGDFRMRTVSRLPPRIPALEFGEAKNKRKDLKRAKGDDVL